MYIKDRLSKRELLKYGIFVFFLLILAFSAQYNFLASVNAGETKQLGSKLYLIIGFSGFSLLLLALVVMLPSRKALAVWSETQKSQLIISCIAYTSIALITGFIFFILCRIDVGMMAAAPDQIIQVKDVTAYLLQFYMGIRTDITVESSLGLYILLILSGFLLICVHLLAGSSLSGIVVGKPIWILSLTGILLISCFLIRMIWGLPLSLVFKLILMLILSFAVFLTGCLKKQKLNTKSQD